MATTARRVWQVWQAACSVWRRALNLSDEQEAQIITSEQKAKLSDLRQQFEQRRREFDSPRRGAADDRPS